MFFLNAIIYFNMKAIGIASDMAARDKGAGLGVWNIFYNKDIKLDWQNVFFAKSNKTQLKILPELLKLNTNVAIATKKLIEQNDKGLFFSGDHSSAVGIWSGVAEAKRKDGNIGLIWIDAHLDSHTPESSHSKNIHGMPAQFLLGQSNYEMSKILSDSPKIKPQNICFIGIRSYQKEEQDLLNKLGCKIFYIEDVQKNGIANILTQAHKIVTQNTVGFGISIDIDSFDPSIAPGTGYIENGGLIFDQDFSNTLKQITNNNKFLGAEISEYLPANDKNDKTINLIKSILSAIS
jgi:arginase